jgi:iron complex outermembrane recepter protein
LARPKLVCTESVKSQATFHIQKKTIHSKQAFRNVNLTIYHFSLNSAQWANTFALQTLTKMKLNILHKNFIALLAIISTAFTAHAANITGQINSKAGGAVAEASVILYKPTDSSVTQLAASTANGAYEFTNIKDGTYWIIASRSGFLADTLKNVTVNGANVSAPTITLAQDKRSVGEIRATARKQVIEVKPGKTIVNVDASINNAGSNALEILRKSPGVTVDNNEQLSIKGKSGVVVYIDGKQNYMDQDALAAFLKSLNSSNIQSIEIISNPGSKYDAEGNAGIINIKLKKNTKLGTNGTASLGGSIGITPKYNSSITINNNNAKTNIFAMYGIDGGRQHSFQYFTRNQSNIEYNQEARNFNEGTNQNYKVGVDYKLNSKHTIGILSNGNFTNGNWTNRSNTFIGPNSNAYNQILNASNRIDATNTNINGNVNYRFADTSGRTLTIDLDAGQYNATSRSFQPNDYTTLQNVLLNRLVFTNSAPVKIDIKTAKFDYEANAFKGKIGFGAKTAFVNTDNDFKFYNATSGVEKIDSNRTNYFKYLENVNAAYANYSRKINEKWSTELGLRAEQTISKGTLESLTKTLGDTTIDRNYFNLFPNLGLSYQPSWKHGFALSFSRRIQRPDYQQLNPFENKLDELTYQKGNAFLRPQYAYNAEFTYTFMGFANAGISYSRLTDVFAEITDTADGARSFITNRNMANSDVWGLTIGSPLQIKKWWTGYATVTGNFTKTRASFNGNPINISYPSFNFYGEQNFELTHGYTVSVSGWYNIPGYWGGTFKSKPMGALDLGASKNFLNKKLNVKFAFTDVFFTSRWRGISDYAGLKLDARGGWESRQVRLTLRYRFGSNTVQASRQRKTGMSEEASRIKKGN